jgi:membrane protease subunit (stomatin/prohibitin family)
MIIFSAVIDFFFTNSQNHLTHGFSSAVWMTLFFLIYTHYDLYKKPNYKSLEFTPKFSKWEIILKISSVFSIKIADNILFIQDINAGIEFLENNKILVIGRKGSVNKLEKLLSIDYDWQK